MKKLFILCILSLLLVSATAACTNDKKDSAVENSSTEESIVKKENEKLLNFEQADKSRLEQGILLVGESAKGGYYLTTVQSAYVDSSNDYIVVNFSVKNVRGQMIGLSELKYTLKDEKDGKAYEGKVLDQTPSSIQVIPNETVKLKIAFEVPSVADEYMFYMESSLDPLEAHWKIDKLQSPKN